MLADRRLCAVSLLPHAHRREAGVQSRPSRMGFPISRRQRHANTTLLCGSNKSLVNSCYKGMMLKMQSGNVWDFSPREKMSTFM